MQQGVSGIWRVTILACSDEQWCRDISTCSCMHLCTLAWLSPSFLNFLPAFSFGKMVKKGKERDAPSLSRWLFSFHLLSIPSKNCLDHILALPYSGHALYFDQLSSLRPSRISFQKFGLSFCDINQFPSYVYYLRMYCLLSTMYEGVVECNFNWGPT